MCQCVPSVLCSSHHGSSQLKNFVKFVCFIFLLILATAINYSSVLLWLLLYSSYTLISLCIAGTPRWPSGKAEDPKFESRLRRAFFGVESYQWLKNWHSSGYPARRLVL